MTNRDPESTEAQHRLPALDVTPDELRTEAERLSRELSLAETQLAEASRQLEELRGLERERVRVEGTMESVARRLLPPGSRARRAVRSAVGGARVLRREGPREFGRRLRLRLRLPRETNGRVAADPAELSTATDQIYAEWLARVEPDPDELDRQRAESRAWEECPLVSVVMPIHDVDVSLLDAAVGSVLGQSYEQWELCIADDASILSEMRDRLLHWSASDPRIRVVLRETNGGITAATNSAIATATGRFVAFLDPNDVLRPHALFSAVSFLRAHPDHSGVYSDEDHLRQDGARVDPYMKGGFSRDLLLSNNYMGRILVVERTLLDEVGGMREDFEGNQDYDLALRLTERGVVGHVPGVLYSRRQIAGSTAIGKDARDHGWDAGARAIEDALRRRHVAGRVENGVAPGWYTVRYRIQGKPLVTVIVPTRDRVDLLRACVRSIENRTDWPSWRLVIVDNGSVEEETLEYLAVLPHDVIRDPEYFNYSRLMNAGARAATGEHLLFLNNDIEVVTPEWMTAMLEHSQRPEVGGVGARLLYPDGRPQHEGIRVGGGILPGNIDFLGYQNLGRSIREVSAATGACFMLRRDVFDHVGGFDERLRVAFNDVDLCLRIRRTGFTIIYQPLAELIHRESASRGPLHPRADERLLASLWGDPESLTDPYVNPWIKSYSPFILR